MTLRNRLDRLEEKTAPSAAVERAERRARWCARWRRRSLYRVLLRIRKGAGDGADEFVSRVVEAYRAAPGGDGFDAHPLRVFIDNPVYGHGDGMNGHPCAPLPQSFPRRLVEFLLTGPAVNLYHSCEACGLHVPHWRDRPHPACVIYPGCPSCGGPTSYTGYWNALEAARGIA